MTTSTDEASRLILQDLSKKTPPLGSPTNANITLTCANNVNINGVSPVTTNTSESEADSTMFPVMTAVIPVGSKKIVTINNNVVPVDPHTESRAVPLPPQSGVVPQPLESQPVATNGNGVSNHEQRKG